MIKTYEKNTGDQSVRTETTYKIQLTREELDQLAHILDTASFNFHKGARDLLNKFVSQFPHELCDFEE
ncbi:MULTISPECIES: hypothetical protein [Acinetobacter]|jgi:hypothetical protein|uniref:hypothetical protein n=1 Tax=Acinetobacter TaxID=469 RepID=UPI000DD014CC|nr:MULTISPECIES: hypothetical protein [Acinetobacter]